MILRQLTDEVSLKGINTINESSIVNVPANTETTVITLTATVDHKIFRISVSGDDYAKYRLYIDTNLVETRRAGPQRTLDFIFNSPLLLTTGQILDIKVLHCFTGDQLDFESTIYSRV